MSLFIELIQGLLPRSKILCEVYCDSHHQLFSLFSFIPAFIKYIIACFFQQMDAFVASGNAVNWYDFSNYNQTIYRSSLWDEWESETKIYGTNVIKIQYELSELINSNQLLFTWTINIDIFPGVGSWHESSLKFGFISDDINETFYCMNDLGNAGYLTTLDPQVKPFKYRNLAQWGGRVKNNDVIKMEFSLFKRKNNKCSIKFYKNNILYLEYHVISEECDYKMYLSSNSYHSQYTIIDFKCQIS